MCNLIMLELIRVSSKVIFTQKNRPEIIPAGILILPKTASYI